MFFKKSRFNLSEKYIIEFNDAALAESQKLQKTVAGAPARRVELTAALHRLLRDNVAQVVLLELVRDSAGKPLPAPAPLCVANTHLFWDPEFADVKLWQTVMLVKELEKFTAQVGRTHTHTHTLLHSLTRTYTHTLTHTHPKNSHAHTHTLTHTHTHVYTHTHTRVYTHTHAHTRSVYRRGCG